MKRLLVLPLVVLLAGLPVFPALAQAPTEVVIGVLYPLSGPVAQVGIDALNAVKLAVEIVNGKYDLALPLARTQGLPNFGGAKIRIIAVDHQGKPDVGQAEAERLITKEKVHALFGAYQSAVTATASQVAERYGIPFLNAESSSPGLTDRGFKWFSERVPTTAISAR